MTSGFTEDEIRPDALRQAQSAAFAADVARLRGRQTEFLEACCPACGSSACRERFLKEGFRYVECGGCETLFMNPRPTPAVLNDYYRTSLNADFWAEHMFPQSNSARTNKIVRPRVDRLQDLCTRSAVERSVLIEIGAGDGAFAGEVAARQLFSRVIAIEPCPAHAAACRRRGVEVIELPIEEAVVAPGLADVIAAFETIEHLFDPRRLLERCHELLKPGGLVVLSCPNVKGFDVAVLGAVSDSIDAEHLNYFHPKSLAHLLRATGFEIVELSTPGCLDAELVRKKVLSGLFDLSGQPFLRQLLIDEWDRLGQAFQQFLAAERLSSHMFGAARKPV
jgi:2-polyprenyl-3-methyl-5-hydroxy-6-metoxy-1,4-benzoquinol methylase